MLNVKYLFLGEWDSFEGAASSKRVVDNEKKKLEEEIDNLSKELKVKFIGGEILNSEEQLDSSFSDVDIMLVSLLGGISDEILHVLYSYNIPMIIYTKDIGEIFSWGSLWYPYFMKDIRKMGGGNVDVVTNVDELRDKLKIIGAAKKLRTTKILCIGNPMYSPFRSRMWGYFGVRKAREKFGVQIEFISASKFIEMIKNMDYRQEAASVAEEFMSGALEIKEPTKEKIVDAARLYLLIKDVIAKRDVNAFTINCLESQIISQTGMVPCFALSRLNNEGIPAACEADITSLMNMLMVSYISNKPCFMVNPYLYPCSDRVILSHCVSPTKLDGISKEPSPYIIRSHFDSGQGVASQVLLREEQEVTITGLSYDKLDTLMVAKGVIKKNTGFPTCRTQVEVKVENCRKLLDNYHGRHWMLVYGDYKEKLQSLCNLLGINFVEV